MKDPTATQEQKDAAKAGASEAQKVGLYLKKEIKRRKDEAAALLAEAKAKAQAELDRKNEVKLDSKAKLKIAGEVQALADVTADIKDLDATADADKIAEIKRAAQKKVRNYVTGLRKDMKKVRKENQDLVKK